MLSKVLFLVSEIFVLVSALVQSVLLIINNELSAFWTVVIIALISVNVILIIGEAKKMINLLNKVTPRSDLNKISDYLLNWIKSGQRIAIVSRDLSWVKDRIKDELIKKSKAGELIVFLPKNNNVSHELMEAGAEVKYYMYGTENIHNTYHSISSRFIIAGYESTPRLTTPNRTKDFHIHEEFEPDEFPTKITSDMIDIMRSTTHLTIPFSNQDKAAINEYLINWLSNGGRCFVLSRDLSWANDEQVKKCMIAKAKHGEITIFMQKESEISNELAACGADVRYYETLNHVFKNRFIISHWGTVNSKVTVRSIHDDIHINHVYDSSHRLFSYAVEIAELLDKVVPASPRVILKTQRFAKGEITSH